MKYDLELRTKNFSISILRLIKKLKKTKLYDNIISQLIRSATSVGVNYHEANGSSSKRDFKNKIALCRKEIQETKYWIELLNGTNPEDKESLQEIWTEAHELTLIFNKIWTTLGDKKMSSIKN